jgi:hypothetical protein
VRVEHLVEELAEAGGNDEQPGSESTRERLGLRIRGDRESRDREHGDGEKGAEHDAEQRRRFSNSQSSGQRRLQKEQVRQWNPGDERQQDREDEELPEHGTACG